MGETVFIYGLVDPRDEEVRYVGKACDLVERLDVHLKDARRQNTPKNAWILKLRKLNAYPSIIVLEEVAKECWAEREKWWITYYRQNGRILNICDGGEGRNGPVSEETRHKLSIAGKGRKPTPAMIELLRQRSTGRHPSLETRQKLSDSHKGQKLSEQTRQKLSLSLKGRPKSEDHKRKIGQAQIGKTMSARSRRKMSLSKQGWTPPDSLRQVCSLVNKGSGNGRAILSDEVIQSIRSRYSFRKVTLKSLALEYGVGITAVHRVVRGKSWTHI